MRRTLLATLLFAALAAAQQPTITLHAVVTDAKGTPVPNLPANALTLQDNGATTPLLTVQAGDPEPQKLLIVLDAVNTTYTEVAYERQQLQHLLTANNGKLPLPTSIVIAADTTLQATSGYTTDGVLLNAALQKQTVALRDIRRSAGFYGAEERLDISLKAFGRVLALAGSTPGHKLVVWISPGWPLLSGPNVELSGKDETRLYQQIESFSQAIHAANATLYSVNPLGTAEDLNRTFYYKEFLDGVRKPGKAQLGNLGIQVLAAQSGGLVLNGSNDTGKLVEQCVADSTAPYTLTFTPSPSEPGSDYHRLDLRTTDTSLKARTTTGLYLPQPK